LWINDLKPFDVITLPNIDDPEPGDRTHPWTATEYGDEKNAGGRYVDFKQFPEKIPETLEDFIPYASWPAVQHFYAFLAWINSSKSGLETNDCAFRGPSANRDTLFRKTTRLDGRVELFARNYQSNVERDCFLWLQRMLFIYLQLERQSFKNGLLSISTKNTTYLALPEGARDGKRISIVFNAYGDGDSDAFENLFIVFDVIWESCKRVNAAMNVAMPELP
jgi:hypothetical protein